MGNSSENLATTIKGVLELLRVRRQSGLLSVRRIENGRFEEGEIYVHEGQLTSVRAGYLSGQDALVWLQSWPQAQYEFVAGASLPTKRSTDVPSPSSQQELSPSTLTDGHASVASSSASRNTLSEQLTTKPMPADIENRVPRKFREEENVMSLPLTRPQRLVYMLVDGERTIADLARCTRKTVQEVCRLLSELQEQGLTSL